MRMANRVAWSLAGIGLVFCALVALVFFAVLLTGFPVIAISFALMAIVLTRASYIAFQLASGLSPSPLLEWKWRLRWQPKTPSPQNAVRIIGKVRIAGRPLRAPLSERPCAFFDARIEDERRELVQHSEGQDFFVEHAGGRDLVCIDYVRVRVKLDAEYFSSGAQATSRQKALLHRLGRSPDGELRYREGTLTEGETVEVVGNPRLEPDPDPRSGAPFREMPMRRVFAGADVYVTDDVRVAR
jgi:hypothetical protein